MEKEWTLDGLFEISKKGGWKDDPKSKSHPIRDKKNQLESELLPVVLFAGRQRSNNF